MKQNMKVFIPATLGMLTAFGPFVTDLYLPVLPEMTGYFHTTPALASMSLTAGMIGLAAGQLFIGPLTDKYGRKRILVGSMLLFVVASLLCIFSGDIFMFNAMRVLQGLAGAGGIVIAKSMSADMYTGRELASFMALLGAINGIAPVCARWSADLWPELRRGQAFLPSFLPWELCSWCAACSCLRRCSLPTAYGRA